MTTCLAHSSWLLHPERWEENHIVRPHVGSLSPSDALRDGNDHARSWVLNRPPLLLDAGSVTDLQGTIQCSMIERSNESHWSASKSPLGSRPGKVYPTPPRRLFSEDCDK